MVEDDVLEFASGAPWSAEGRGWARRPDGASAAREGESEAAW